MSYGQLRKVVKFIIPIGIAFLVIGVFLFMNADVGTKEEKVGIVMMMYSGIVLGIGFAVLVALKTPSN